MAFHPDTLAAFEADNIGTWIYLIQLELDTGTVYYTTAPEDKIFNLNTYQSLGAIGGFSSVKETDQLDPADYSITIGAVDSAIIQLFLGQNILNRTCIVYQALMDDNQAYIGEPWDYFKGLLQPALINDGDEPVILLEVKDILADWDRDIESRYTDAEQRRLHPGDYCLEFISKISGLEITWPASSFWE